MQATAATRAPAGIDSVTAVPASLAAFLLVCAALKATLPALAAPESATALQRGAFGVVVVVTLDVVVVPSSLPWSRVAPSPIDAVNPATKSAAISALIFMSLPLLLGTDPRCTRCRIDENPAQR